MVFSAILTKHSRLPPMVKTKKHNTKIDLNKEENWGVLLKMAFRIQNWQNKWLKSNNLLKLKK